MGTAWQVYVDWPKSFDDFVGVVRSTLGIELAQQPPAEHLETGNPWFWRRAREHTSIEVWHVDGYEPDGAWFEPHEKGGANFSAEFYRASEKSWPLAVKLYEVVVPRARHAWLVFDLELEYSPTAPLCTRCGRGRETETTDRPGRI